MRFICKLFISLSSVAVVVQGTDLDVLRQWPIHEMETQLMQTCNNLEVPQRPSQCQRYGIPVTHSNNQEEDICDSKIDSAWIQILDKTLAENSSGDWETAVEENIPDCYIKELNGNLDILKLFMKNVYDGSPLEVAINGMKQIDSEYRDRKTDHDQCTAKITAYKDAIRRQNVFGPHDLMFIIQMAAEACDTREQETNQLSSQSSGKKSWLRGAADFITRRSN
jgi:hypothetical protein